MPALEQRRGDDVATLEQATLALPVQTLLDEGILTPTAFHVGRVVELTERSNADDLTQVPEFLRWAAIGSWLGGLNAAVKWWIGDWLAFGEGAWGERYAQAAEATGLDIGTLQNYAYVCRQVLPSRRRPPNELSFTGHLKVAKLEPAAQKQWIDFAVEHGLRSKDLEAAIRQHGPTPPKSGYRPPLVVVDPLPPTPAPDPGLEARHENATVEICKGRWAVRIKVVDKDSGEVHEYVASADSGITMGDQIFFGTAAEYAEAEKSAG